MGATAFPAPLLGRILKGRHLKTSVILCWLVCLCFPVLGFGYTSGELYRQAKAATVLIVGIDDDTQSLSFGSGVFVSGDGLLLTNAHVIKDATRLFVYSQTQDVDTQPEVLAVEPDWDLAALRVAAPRPTPFLSIVKEAAEEGDSAIAVGYPRLPDVLRMGLTIHPTVFPVTITGEAMGRSRTTGQPIPFAQITGFMNAGSSGGPLVLSETGEIAGLVVHSVPYLERSKNQHGEVIGTVMLRAGLSYCIPASLLRTWLQKSHLSFVEGPNRQPGSTKVTPPRQSATFAATAHLLHAMASVLHGDGDLLDLSIHHYEAALRLDPERSDVLRDLALAWVGKNELDRARTIVDRALALAPNDPALLTDAADLRRRLNMADAAASLYRAALRQDGCFARASFGLGVVLKGQGLLEEAAESFRHSAQCPPSSSFAAYKLGLDLEQQGQSSTALHVWNNFLRRADRLPSNELPILTKIRQRASQLRASVERSVPPSAVATHSAAPHA
ncbi:MAG TPA: trypsin-like peptidase domain-containing protein, partial [Nitrospiraceae bacterium]|nr:trypsin-like peptidase domain-containing protein [Nitrospiraceae bacterium]